MTEGHRWLIGTATAIACLIVAILAWQDPKAAPSSQPVSSPSSVAPASTARPTPSTVPATITAPTPTTGELQYSQLQVGDCLTGANLNNLNNDNPSESWPTLIPAVPCDQAHIAEVFYANKSFWDGTSSPPNLNFEYDSVGNECANAFQSYTSASPKQGYTWQDIEPKLAEWRNGDRAMYCIVYHLNNEDIITTMRGSVKRLS